MEFCYRFPAVKGAQAKRDYYVAMIPISLLSKLFPADDAIEALPPEYRAQRKLNETRIPEIKQYILDNRESYVFSALAASVDGSFEFQAFQGSKEIGILSIPMDAKILINDGQHRKAAIESALAEDPSLGEETISIVFFKDKGLIRSQQMFTDLNKHAVKTSNSLATLYNSRDALAGATNRVIDSVNFLRLYTDKERDILGKNSPKLFTLNNIYVANQRIIHHAEVSEEDEQFLLSYWSDVSANIVEWNELLSRDLSRKELKESYIIALAVVLKSLGRLGAYFYDNRNVCMSDALAKLKNVDWTRSNKKNWQGRVVRADGKIMNSEEAAILTCNKIKQLIGLPLGKEEKLKEQQFGARTHNG